MGLCASAKGLPDSRAAIRRCTIRRRASASRRATAPHACSAAHWQRVEQEERAGFAVSILRSPLRRVRTVVLGPVPGRVAKGKTAMSTCLPLFASQDAAIRSDAIRVPIAVQSRRISRVAIDAGDARRKKQRSATLPTALQPPCCCACARDGASSSEDRSPRRSRSAARSRKGRPSPTFYEGHQYRRRSRRCRGTRTPCRATS